MLQWIRQAFGKSPSEMDRVARWATKLQALLAPFATESSRPGLAEDIQKFVLTGEPATLLGELARLRVAATHLKLDGDSHTRWFSAENDIYIDFAEVAPALALRWAQVLEASSQSLRTRAFLQLPNGARWPEILLLHSAGRSLELWSSERTQATGLTLLHFEGMLAEAGLPRHALLTAAFAASTDTLHALKIVALPGAAEAILRHVEVLRPLLLSESMPQRLHALEMLQVTQVESLDALAPELCELATSSSKQLRAAAAPFIEKCASGAVAPLQSIAVEGKPEQRVHALRLLKTLAHSSRNSVLEEFALRCAAADKASSVQALVTEWARDQSAERTDDYHYELPVVEFAQKLTPATRSALQDLWQDINRAISANNERMQAHAESTGGKFVFNPHDLLTEEALAELREYIESPEVTPKRQAGDSPLHAVTAALEQLALAPEITPVILAKVLQFLSQLTRHRGLAFQAVAAFEAMHQKLGAPTLLELAQIVEPIAERPDLVFDSYCSTWNPLAHEWSSEDTWPFFAHNVDVLIQRLTQLSSSRDYWFDRSALYQSIATFPKPPARLIDALYAVALGTLKSERRAAQDALEKHEGKEVRIIAALADGKSEVRAVAAQWLGRLRWEAAVGALEKAVAKEKNDVAQGALLDALQALGYPVEKYLDRAALAADAQKNLARGLPKELEWFPFASLPSVHWADSGERVSDEVLRWLLVQAVRRKSPEPNAILLKYCGMLRTDEREQLGQFVLEAWLREDVRPISAEDAQHRALFDAQQTHASMARYPQFYQKDPRYGLSIEEMTAHVLPHFLRLPAGSAIGSKGLLAIAAACANERAAAPVQRYLKEYYGTRAAQGKALIAMLAWIDHPTATQLVLSVGSRFRTKSFQDEATKQAEALAERKGWTLAELADRTIPTAGFDEAGELTLDYGARQFTARLLPDFKIELFNPEGKKLSALPEPRQDDDVELAKAAKKALSTTKKELKGVVTLQGERLYEALCTAREWPFEDWRTYLQAHPLLRHLVQRVVWIEMDGERVVRSFRPLDDGTLTDVDDNPVELGTAARIRLAHGSLVEPNDGKRWMTHLVDYEIQPLFQQFGKEAFQLPEDMTRADSLRTFEGHMIEAFKLRGRALKLGYTRGPAEDGGWFYVYEKRFPTLGLKAVIEFTGNPLPEENRTVALQSLSYERTQAEGRAGGKLALGKVSPVLLSEGYGDMRLIAADGTGYDAEWEKKSEL